MQTGKGFLHKVFMLIYSYFKVFVSKTEKKTIFLTNLNIDSKIEYIQNPMLLNMKSYAGYLRQYCLIKAMMLS